MGRRLSLLWGIIAVAAAAVLVYGPAEIARSATGPGEPVSFLTQPQQGWRFVLDALDAIGTARAGSPASAKALAVRAFAGTTVLPERVDLLYVPDLRVPVGAGRRPLAAKAKLVWRVSGQTRPGGRVTTVGLLDFETGRLTYRIAAAG
jgi:hypothetical protein